MHGGLGGPHACRLAMQLLAARRSEADKAGRAERSAPTAQAIARHRLALLAEVRSLCVAPLQALTCSSSQRWRPHCSILEGML